MEAVLVDREGLSVAGIANAIGLPRATAHRQISTLIDDGFLVRVAGGRLCPGPRLLSLLDLVDAKQVIVAAAAPILHRLADKLGCLVQLGTLENDMVTYRIKTGQGAGDLFTRVGMQLEAYCTGIGKVLLAHLPTREREAYLATGPFPALTQNTITNPDRLREELEAIARQGFAHDLEEMAEGLVCIAVPVVGAQGAVVAAISASHSTKDRTMLSKPVIIELLLAAADQVRHRITVGQTDV